MARRIAMRSVYGAQLAEYVEDLARLRIAVFREYPYLYDGSAEYERQYLATYLRSPESVAVVATDGDAVIGASTGLPLDCETADCKAPFRLSPYPVERVFYCGESVLLEAYRGRGLYRRFFEARERHARELGRFDACAFCAVERPPGHPLRPRGYVPLDAVWTKFGYVKHPELVAEYRWKDVERETETGHAMTFWLKSLPAVPA